MRVLDDMEDLSQVNIFTTETNLVEREVESFTMINTSFALPPHQITEIHETVYVPDDLSIVSFFPSHLLGQSWEVFAVTSINDTIPFIKIKNWDFDWQNFYYPDYMIYIPAGSTVHAKAIYDNTSNNPNNPNSPPQYVFWGDDTTDEMFYLPISYVLYQEGDENLYLGSEEVIIGDINYDGSINIIDVVLIVNYVLNPDSLGNEQILVSDLNNDQSIDILDVVELINNILMLW